MDELITNMGEGWKKDSEISVRKFEEEKNRKYKTLRDDLKSCSRFTFENLDDSQLNPGDAESTC